MVWEKKEELSLKTADVRFSMISSESADLTRLKQTPGPAMCKRCGAVQKGRHSPR